jgi:hypothetical protein
VSRLDDDCRFFTKGFNPAQCNSNRLVGFLRAYIEVGPETSEKRWIGQFLALRLAREYTKMNVVPALVKS